MDSNSNPAETIVSALVAASRSGEIDSVGLLLAEEAEMHADEAAVRMGATPVIRDPRAIAAALARQARLAQPATIDGRPGLVRAKCGQIQLALAFTIEQGRIQRIRVVARTDDLARMTIHSTVD